MAEGGVRALWRRLLRGRGVRPWTALIAWPLAAGAATIALVRLLGLDRIAPLVQLIAFTPYVIVAGAIAAVLIGLTRRVVAAAVTAVAAMALLVVVAPRGLGSPDEDGSGTQLVVMSANLRIGGADAASLVELVREAGVDVLALQEFTPEAERALDAAGLSDLLPHSQRSPGSGGSGSALYARWPLTDPGVRLVSAPGFDQAYATLALEGVRSVVVESVHPVPPSGIRQTARWLTGLRNQIPAGAAGPPRILAGDFNATLDHAALRDLLDTGYRDAADSVGAGLTPTWPFYGPRSLVTPKVALDHILVPAGIGVRDFRAVTIPRSDHRAIVATLLIP